MQRRLRQALATESSLLKGTARLTRQPLPLDQGGATSYYLDNRVQKP
ncbi:hypothetical protein SBF1_190041 [Candidatus Desulfosporosinus infrequens]|uniref:Uncharacterized protein n=1 Tax=Candidatus Desulfosporosinus infrequens TaxID=2043169 RepID=A0A2U3KEX3_9FIRM|nr:hypothetical protein SBF1_190041 [Candidatus Desulfosporosinus infrequens]